MKSSIMKTLISQVVILMFVYMSDQPAPAADSGEEPETSSLGRRAMGFSINREEKPKTPQEDCQLLVHYFHGLIQRINLDQSPNDILNLDWGYFVGGKKVLTPPKTGTYLQVMDITYCDRSEQSEKLMWNPNSIRSISIWCKDPVAKCLSIPGNEDQEWVLNFMAHFNGQPTHLSCSTYTERGFPGEVIFNNFNGGGVVGNPTEKTVFKIDSDVRVTEIITFHHNSYRGEPAGNISIRGINGTVADVKLPAGPGINSWANYFLPNANWIAKPDNLVLKKGSYEIDVSDRESWSRNMDSGNAGYAIVWGEKLESPPPAPSPPPPPPPDAACAAFEGVWDFWGGDLRLEQEGDYFYGTYEDEKSELWGICTGNEIIGYWMEPSSQRECPEPAPSKDGYPKKARTKYWGRIVLKFTDSVDKLEAQWGYCDDEPDRQVDNMDRLQQAVQPVSYPQDGSYNGEIVDGKRHGQGSCDYPSGDSYEGQWKNGVKEGTGTYTWKNGDEYIGEFMNDRRTGDGTFVWADSGDRYVGQFKDDLATGGQFFWADGKQSERSYQESSGEWVHKGIASDDTGQFAKGDISFILTWKHSGDSAPNGPDIDIWVEDPLGNRLQSSYASSMGPTKEGGQVDIDDEGGYAESGDEGSGGGPERVFWPQGKSPQGTYKFGCTYWEGDGTARCNLDVFYQGKKVKTATDTLEPESKESEVHSIAIGGR